MQNQEITTEQQSKDSFEKSMNKRAEYDDFFVEDWYPKLQSFTPKTIFMDLSEEEGKAIITYYNMAFKFKNNLKFEHTEVLKSLEKRIGEAIKTEFHKSAIFVRLSTRSPKDGISLHCQEILEDQENSYYELKEAWKLEDKNLKLTKEELEANICLASLFKAEQKALRCSKGSEAMSLLLTSERVYNDLCTELACAEAARLESKESWNMKLSLREWNDKIDGFMEFRCFIKENNFRAISQCNHYIIIGDLLEVKKVSSVKESIFNFWNTKIKDLLGYLKDYIIDFAVNGDDLYVIELNPYLPNTGPGLFNWEADKELLQNGQAYENVSLIPFKVKDTPFPQIESIYENSLKTVKDHCYNEEPYYELLEQLNPDYRDGENEDDDNEEKNSDGKDEDDS